MKVKKVIKLKSKFPQCDLTTSTENFFIKVGDQYILVHNSPALFCYHTYSGYPDNGIALKGFVNGPQNVMTSKEEIDEKYGDRATMKQMLYYGLELAKCIPDGECWQGDCLFTSDSKKEENILGKDYITFQPNKIIYAFSEDQPGYEEVKNAVFGICFHTIYSGENKSQTFKCDPTRLKNVPSNFYIMSPALNVNKESFNVDQIKAHIAKLSRLESQLLSNEGYETLVSNSKFMKDYWSTFENKVLADRQQTTINETTFINELKDYISEKLGKDIDKLKTDKSKARAQQKLADLLDLVENNKQVLTLLVKTLNEAANIKMLLWEGFRQAKFDYSTFYKHRNLGYIRGEPEGIACSDNNGNIVKIVDRSKFSSINRDDNYLSGFIHESILNEYKKIPVPSKDELLDKYINQNLRLSELAKLYNTNITTVKQWLRGYDIKKDKSLAAANQSASLLSRTPEEVQAQQAKSRETSMARYGNETYRNPQKNIETNKKNHGGVYTSNNQQKYYDTLIDRFGSVEAAYEQIHKKVSATKELRYGDKNYNNPEKTANTNLSKYGVRAPAQNKEIYSKINKPYHYNGEKFSSSWELAYYIYNLDHNIQITHEPDMLEYFSNGKKYYYVPDFKVNDTYVEIKGDQFIDKNTGNLIDFYGKLDDQRELDKQRCMIENNVQMLSKKDILPYLKYIQTTYGKDYLKSFKVSANNEGWEHNESLGEAVIRRDFNKLIEEEEQVDPSKTLVFSFGKFNPPTIGHLKLAQTMANCNETSNKPVVYLSHKIGLDKNNPVKSQPLDYEEKLYWCKKAFGNLVEVVESNAKNPWEALHEINEKRPEIERIIFAGGDDRANGSMYSNLVRSNGKQTSKPGGDYSFIKGIVPLNAGARDESSDDISETASSSLVRKCVLENDFDKFQKLVPFNEADAEDLFEEIKDFYGRLNEDLLLEKPAEGWNVNNVKEILNNPEGYKNDYNELKDLFDKANRSDVNNTIAIKLKDLITSLGFKGVNYNYIIENCRREDLEYILGPSKNKLTSKDLVNSHSLKELVDKTGGRLSWQCANVLFNIGGQGSGVQNTGNDSGKGELLLSLILGDCRGSSGADLSTGSGDFELKYDRGRISERENKINSRIEDFIKSTLHVDQLTKSDYWLRLFDAIKSSEGNNKEDQHSPEYNAYKELLINAFNNYLVKDNKNVDGLIIIGTNKNRTYEIVTPNNIDRLIESGRIKLRYSNARGYMVIISCAA